MTLRNLILVMTSAARAVRITLRRTDSLHSLLHEVRAPLISALFGNGDSRGHSRDFDAQIATFTAALKDLRERLVTVQSAIQSQCRSDATKLLNDVLAEPVTATPAPISDMLLMEDEQPLQISFDIQQTYEQLGFTFKTSSPPTKAWRITDRTTTAFSVAYYCIARARRFQSVDPAIAISAATYVPNLGTPYSVAAICALEDPSSNTRLPGWLQLRGVSALILSLRARSLAPGEPYHMVVCARAILQCLAFSRHLAVQVAALVTNESDSTEDQSLNRLALSAADLLVQARLLGAPPGAGLSLLLADALHRSGAYDEAAEEFSVVQRAYQDDWRVALVFIQLCRTVAERWKDNTQLTHSIAVLQEALESGRVSEGRRLEAQVALGDLLWRIDRCGESLEHLGAALALAPNSTETDLNYEYVASQLVELEILKLISRVQFRLGRWRGVTEHISRARKLDSLLFSRDQDLRRIWEVATTKMQERV